MLIVDEIKKADPQLRSVAVAVALGLVTLLAGLWYVQVVSSRRYQADLQEQSLRIVRVPAIRGKILDRNGDALVENRPSYNVNVYLEEFRRKFRFEYTNHVLKEYRAAFPNTRPVGKVDENLQASARFRVVSNLMAHVGALVQKTEVLDEKQFKTHYESQRSLPFPLLRDLTVQQVASFAENSAQSPSLALEVQPIRIYPWTNTAAHLLGHLRRETNPDDDDEEIAFQFRLPDYVGVMGIELAFDQQLRGRAGVKSVLVNNLQYRQAEEILTPPQPGHNVVLTLDLAIQRATERALRNVHADTRGAAVVMDCRTGDILASASVPSFDPNVFASRISEEEWAKLSDPTLLPQLNRATYGTYAPGSIFKIVVALACLEAGTLRPDDVFESKGYYQIDGRGRVWGDTAGPGVFDFQKAFYLSSNPYFIEHGLRAGFERVVEMGRRFGLGTRTGLNTRQEAAGYFPDPNDKIKKNGSRWMPGDTANLCIGQGELLVTPLQMAVMTAAIANGGKILEPRLVDRVEPADPDQGGEVTRFPSGQVRGHVRLSPKHVKLVKDAMLLDVEHRDPVTGRHGTGYRAAVDGIRVCGKTGTAQVKENGKLKEYITWFVSFAPFENPRYAVVVVVEGGDSGGGTCAPVAHDIFSALLQWERRNRMGPQEAVALN